MPRGLVVVGAGAWGTALAIHIARSDRPVTLWGHDPAHMAGLSTARENVANLPGVRFPEALAVESDLAHALSGGVDVLIAVPSHVFSETVRRFASLLVEGYRFAWASKGIEAETGRLLSETAADHLPRGWPMAVVSGPSFARELATGLPTALTVAATDPDTGEAVATWLRSERLRIYTASDMIGVQLGGAVKNVMAIAAGVCDGLGFGANARAALITRALAEVRRLGQAMGAQPETFMGLSGAGDLILTCTDDQSRNRRLGLLLAQGRALADAERVIGQVVEGVQTARAVRVLCARHAVEMPITEQVYRVLFEGLSPRAAVSALFAREARAE